MCRQTITGAGVVFRTKVFKDGRAANFAACLRANAKFTDVQVVESQAAPNAKSAKALARGEFVTFKPSNTERQGDMLQREWDSRAERGATEGLDYLFVEAGTGRFWWCYNPISMETYEVSIFSCSCPDYIYRASRVGVQCKHMAAWSEQSRLGVLGQARITVQAEALQAAA